MKHDAQHLDDLLDLLVDAVLRDMEGDFGNRKAAESLAGNNSGLESNHEYLTPPAVAQ
jgi:hypothetical protein